MKLQEVRKFPSLSLQRAIGAGVKLMVNEEIFREWARITVCEDKAACAQRFAGRH